MTRDAKKYKNINLKRVSNINKIEKFTKEKVKIKEIKVILTLQVVTIFRVPMTT